MGILTGVRPTKIAMQKLEKGWERERFIPWFEKKFQVSRQKAQLFRDCRPGTGAASKTGL